MFSFILKALLNENAIENNSPFYALLWAENGIVRLIYYLSVCFSLIYCNTYIIEETQIYTGDSENYNQEQGLGSRQIKVVKKGDSNYVRKETR